MRGGAPPGLRRGAGSRRRNVGRTPPLRWAGAVGRVGRGGQDSVRLPVSPRPRPHVRWAPARRPAAHVAAQPRSQQTPLARPTTWAFFSLSSRAVARRGLLHLPAALLKRVVGRSLSPSVVRPCAWHAGSTAAWGPDRAAVTWGAHAEAAAGGRHRSRGARRAGLGTPAGIAAPTRAVSWAPARRPAAKPAAQQRSQQTPLARPQTWAFCTTPSRAVARLDLRTLPAALLKLALGGLSKAAISQGCAFAKPVVPASTNMVHINPKLSAGQLRITYGGRQSERPEQARPRSRPSRAVSSVAGTTTIRVVACGFGRRRARPRSGSPRAVSPAPDRATIRATAFRIN